MLLVAFSRLCTELPHTGLETRLRFYSTSVKTVLRGIFRHHQRYIAVNHHQTYRNQQITERFTAGESSYDLAKEFGLSRQRIYQIIHKR